MDDILKCGDILQSLAINLKCDIEKIIRQFESETGIAVTTILIGNCYDNEKKLLPEKTDIKLSFYFKTIDSV